MWEKLADAGGGVGVRPGEDVRQPLLEVDAVLPAGGREAGEDGHRDAAALAPHKEPVPPHPILRPKSILSACVFRFQRDCEPFERKNTSFSSTRFATLDLFIIL